jgi:hypothetical protein
MKHVPQEDYLPPLCAILEHGARRRFAWEPVYAQRLRYGRTVLENGKRICSLCDTGGAEGIEKRRVLDENYEEA